MYALKGEKIILKKLLLLNDDDTIYIPFTVNNALCAFLLSTLSREYTTNENETTLNKE